MSNYPSPCDTCSQCTASNGCEAWRIRYLYRQKQINAYAKKIAGRIPTQPREKFLYEHPDLIRNWIETDPCERCMCREWCNGSCPRKDAWKKAKEEKNNDTNKSV